MDNVTVRSSQAGGPQSVDPEEIKPTSNYDLGIMKAAKEWFGKKIDWITGSGDNRSWSSFGAWMLGRGHDKQTGLENRTWGDWIAGRGLDHNNQQPRTWSEFGTQFIPNWALGFSKKDTGEASVVDDATSSRGSEQPFDMKEENAIAIGTSLQEQGLVFEADANQETRSSIASDLGNHDWQSVSSDLAFEANKVEW